MAKARATAESARRDVPWERPALTGRSRVRQILEQAREEIQAAYEVGATCQGLAREYGVPESTMRDFFRREGITMRPLRKVSSEEVAEMVRLREAGWTYREIGEQFGVTRHAVAMRLRRQADAVVDEPPR